MSSFIGDFFITKIIMRKRIAHYHTTELEEKILFWSIKEVQKKLKTSRQVIAILDIEQTEEEWQENIEMLQQHKEAFAQVLLNTLHDSLYTVNPS